MRNFSFVIQCAFFALMLTIFAQLAVSVSAQSAPKPSATPPPAETDAGVASKGSFKVVFDENAPGVVFVESNGERIRVDTAKKAVELLTAVKDDTAGAATNDSPKNSEPAKTNAALKDDEDESPYDFEAGDEPWDYRVVNVPTPKHIPKGSWSMAFTHRFSQEIHPLSESARGLLGLDSFGIASFGVTYGITEKLYVSAYRSPLCRRGTCRAIEIGLGYNWVAQDKDSPIGFSTYASVEGNDNFTEEYTYNLQAMLSARLGKRVYVFFSPAVHMNSNGQRRFNPRPTDYFPAATIANTYEVPTHTASLGMGASILITPNVSVLFDIVPRVGFKMGTIVPIFGRSFNVTGFHNESYPAMGIGIQRNVGRHSFALVFSNTQATTTSRYNSSNLTLRPKDLIIGFNLSRRF